MRRPPRSTRVRSSAASDVYKRQVHARGLARTSEHEVVDTDERLVELVLRADAEAYRDLRTAALAPLADLRPDVRQRLEDTLRSWLLHHGRRQLVADDLFVHAQTCLLYTSPSPR